MDSKIHLRTPVAFLIFNRPDTTKKVFAEISRARPTKLMVVADGPRADHPEDEAKCRQAREIVERVDWECEVLKNYSDVNLGCKQRVSGGLDWVFQTVDRAIILEDDVLPHPTFFRFCDELLDRYAEDERIGAICGCNFLDGTKRFPGSYYFSRYNHVWGWASWARAWKHFDANMKLWPQVRDNNLLRGVIENKKILAYWSGRFEAIYKGEIDTWDYQWMFACWAQSMCAILPEVNLVQNLGFRADATHTKDSTAIEASLTLEPLRFPLVHPETLMRNAAADAYEDGKLNFAKVGTAKRMVQTLMHMLKLLGNRDFKSIGVKISQRLRTTH